MYYQVDLSVLVTQPYIGWLLSGIVATMLIGSGAWLVALPLGTIIGIAGAERSAVLRAGARVYVEIFRNTPLIVQLFLWYFVDRIFSVGCVSCADIFIFYQKMFF